MRGLIGLFEVTALVPIGVLSMLFSTQDQRLGDLAAGTIVIRERAAAPMSRPVVFSPPPGWESYVDTLDVSGMTSGEYETVRAFLLRAYEMAPLPRSNLAARLAGPLASRWQRAVPDGAGPELWLLCVAAAYQRRHGTPPPPAPAMYGAMYGAAPSGWGPPGWGQPGVGGPPGSWGPPGLGPQGSWGPPQPPSPVGPWAPPNQPQPQPQPQPQLQPQLQPQPQPQPQWGTPPPPASPAPTPRPRADGGFARPD